MRKHKHPEHVNHERWLVSYADFITLLFAFFVVMFAVSQVDSRKVGRFTESFSEAMGVELIAPGGSGILPGTSDRPAINPGRSPRTLPGELEGLEGALQKRTEAGRDLAGVKLVQHGNELVLRLSDTVLFESGDDRVREPATQLLRSIAAELAPRPVVVRVEGHTDDVPIKNARFRSNWELSTARATAVIAALATTVAPDRLSAAGYAEFHPVANNATPEGRSQNRRVDLVVSVKPSEAAP